jgi:hypothetical protein
MFDVLELHSVSTWTNCYQVLKRERDSGWKFGNVCIMCHLVTGGYAASEPMMKLVEFDVWGASVWCIKRR